MKKFVLLLCLILTLSASVSLAHSGKTDSDGGHYNRTTGVYHYHHGYEEHQHTNGICPFDFDDQTNHYSTNSTSGQEQSNPADSKKTTEDKWSAYDVFCFIASCVIISPAFILLFKLFTRYR